MDYFIEYENQQTMTKCFEHIILTKNFKQKTKMVGTDDGEEFVNKVITNLLNQNNIKKLSRHTSKGAVFTERFNRTIRNVLKKPVSEYRDANGLGILPTVTKV